MRRSRSVRCLESPTTSEGARACGHPLVGDLARICFGPDSPRVGESIEDLFHDARERGDSEPVRKLADELFRADYFIAGAWFRQQGAIAIRRSSTGFRESASSPSTTTRSRRHSSSAERAGTRTMGMASEWFMTSKAVTRTSSIETPRPSSFTSMERCAYSSSFTLQRARAGSFPMHTPSAPEFFFDRHSIASSFTPSARTSTPAYRANDHGRRVVAPAVTTARDLRQPFIAAPCSAKRS